MVITISDNSAWPVEVLHGRTYCEVTGTFHVDSRGSIMPDVCHACATHKEPPPGAIVIDALSGEWSGPGPAPTPIRPERGYGILCLSMKEVNAIRDPRIPAQPEYD